MRHTPRLLPILIAAAAILLSTKIVGIFLAIDLTPLPQASAETKSAPPPDHAPAAAPEESAPPSKTASKEPTQFSPQEIDVLQTLAKRRTELDKRAGEFDQREALLQATEQRINEKIAKLQEMQHAIDTSFKKEDQVDDAKLKSLVKVYETMKPKDAARIFEQLDEPVVLDVMERMKERGTAAILAAMDPVKAKAVTLGLASRRPAPQLKE